MSSADKGEKLAIVRNYRWRTMRRGGWEINGTDGVWLDCALISLYDLRESPCRFSLDRRRGGVNSQPDLSHPFGHHKCILRSPIGSVRPPSTPPNPPSLTPKLVVCKEFFQALEACHADNWRKWTGGCNNDKTELNMCLRKVVRLPFVRRPVPVPLTGMGVATGSLGAKPGACEGTKKENRERVGGIAP